MFSVELSEQLNKKLLKDINLDSTVMNQLKGSPAIQDYKTEQRKNSFRAAKEEVNKFNSE